MTVGGKMGLESGEPAILEPATILESAPDEGRIPSPFLILGRDLGGSSLNDYTPGATDRAGVHNIGLLVKVCGWYSAGDEHMFYVNDGSRLDPTKVITYGIDLSSYSPSDYLFVTGIVSLEQVDTSFIPIIRILGSGGITKAN